MKNQLYKNTFDVLYPFYLFRIRILKNDPGGYDKSNATEALIVHLLNAYLFDLKNSDELFDEFLNNSTRKMISTLIDKLAFRLSKYKVDRKGTINLDKIKFLWNQAKIQSADNFLDFFVNSPFDMHTSILLLNKYLASLKPDAIAKIDTFTITRSIIELKNYTKRESLLTLECTFLLSHISASRNCLYLINNSVLEILLDLRNMIDKNVLEKLRDIKEFFGNRGFNEFRNI
jgi:hypothetical protein